MARYCPRSHAEHGDRSGTDADAHGTTKERLAFPREHHRRAFALATVSSEQPELRRYADGEQQ